MCPTTETERRKDEGEIRLILSVGKPHESNKWHIIMGTSFHGVIIILQYGIPASAGLEPCGGGGTLNR